MIPGLIDGQGRHRNISARNGYRHRDTTGLEDAGTAAGGLVESDRDVRRPGGKYTEHGENLIAPLGQLHRHRVAGPNATSLQRAGHCQGLRGQVAVGPDPVLFAEAPHHRGCARVDLREIEESFVQASAAHRAVGRIDGASDLDLRGRKPHGRIGIPAVITGAERGHRIGVAREHGVDHAGREGRLTHIPVEQQSATYLGDLRIQQHLRSLGNDPDRFAKGVHDRLGEQLSQIQRAGVHHGCQHRLTAMPAQVPEHIEPRVRRMRSALVHIALQRASAVGHRHLVGEIDVEHDRGGEIANHPVDIGVHRFAMEQRDIQQEPALRRPPSDGFGEHRGHRHRGGDAALMCGRQ